MIIYFSKQADLRVNNIHNDFLSKVNNILKLNNISLEQSINLAIKIKDHYQQYGGSEESFDKGLLIIKENLNFPNLDIAKQLSNILFSFNDTVEEHKIVVLLTANLIEKFINEFLVYLIVSKENSSFNNAIDKVYDKLLSFEKKCAEFKRITNKQFINEIIRFSDNNFSKICKDIKDIRNAFTHHTPFAIGKNASEEAMKILPDILSVFIRLHNEYCIKEGSK